MSFVRHLHTEYSLLNRAMRSEVLATGVRKLVMPACGITDHGNMFSAVAMRHAFRNGSAPQRSSTGKR